MLPPRVQKTATRVAMKMHSPTSKNGKYPLRIVISSALSGRAHFSGRTVHLNSFNSSYLCRENRKGVTRQSSERNLHLSLKGVQYCTITTR
jgi:hypothetical protein